MKRAEYIRYLSGLAAHAATANREATEMLEIDLADVSLEEVMRFTGDMRERLLWIERAAIGFRKADSAIKEKINVSVDPGPMFACGTRLTAKFIDVEEPGE